MIDQTEDTSTKSVPFPIRLSLVGAVLSNTYATVLCCEISDELEVFVSILGGVVCFASSLGKSTKKNMIVCSIASIVLSLFPAGVLRAFLVGAVYGYSQAVSEIHACNISLKAFRSETIQMVNFLMVLQVCLIMFLLAFTPLGSIARLFSFGIITVILQSILAYFFILMPPTEIIHSKTDSDSLIFGEVYNLLSFLFSKSSFQLFHQEYSEIVDKHTGKATTNRQRIFTIIQKLNVSFLSTGLVGILSTGTTNVNYLVVFTAVTMFCWIHANLTPSQHMNMSVLTVLIALILIMIMYRLSPAFVLVMGGSIYLVPDNEGYLALDKSIICTVFIIRSILGAIVYAILAPFMYLI
ncbi:hypothetical protein NEOKW01_1771 [Nematocida sp. AWRm80]|nr:hypothetical protein NEOKW01_1771 [Nematocida sp. AWRm80]